MILYGKWQEDKQIAEEAVWKDKSTIRPIDNPYSTEGGLKILWGNLAPEVL